MPRSSAMPLPRAAASLSLAVDRVLTDNMNCVAMFDSPAALLHYSWSPSILKSTFGSFTLPGPITRPLIIFHAGATWRQGYALLRFQYSLNPLGMRWGRNQHDIGVLEGHAARAGAYSHLTLCTMHGLAVEPTPVTLSFYVVFMC
jgi:hypothetical protein